MTTSLCEILKTYVPTQNDELNNATPLLNFLRGKQLIRINARACKYDQNIDKTLHNKK